MKIQCACGAKYAFDVTPEMARAPIQFVCQNCGQDNSAVINQLIRQQFAASGPGPTTEPGLKVAPAVAIAPPPPGSRAAPAAAHGRAPTPPPAPPPMAPPTTSPPGAAPVVRLSTASATSPAGTEPSGANAAQVCSKHASQIATHRCLVCQKPICPKCMEIFGFVCSAYCRGKAEDQGISLPTYAGQRDLAQSKQWRQAGVIIAAILVLALGGVGFWIWYAWIGSVPKVAFSVRLPDTAYSGELGMVGADQVVFLHAGKLARYDAKTKKEVWSAFLIDKARIAEQAKAALAKIKADFQTAMANGVDLNGARVPDLESVTTDMESDAASELRFFQRGENIWVRVRDKLVRHDWQTGKPAQELSLPATPAQTLSLGDEVVCLFPETPGATVAARLNLLSGELKVDTMGDSTPAAAPASSGSGVTSAKSGKQSSGTMARGNVPGQAGMGRASPANNRALDPKAIASSYQNLSTPARLALPAVAAANANQQRLQAEMQEATPAPPPAAALVGAPAPDLVPSRVGYLQVRSKLLESKMVTRKVMKDPPGKSALNGEVNASATAAVANEILNDMQRERFGDSVQENVSRYQLTLRRLGAKDVADWTGEVIGPAQLFPLETVDVVAAGKSILVFDHNNKKLWEAALNFAVRPVPADRWGFTSTPSPYGAGPCVERGDTLYVFDEGVLTSFELATGNVRWRLPSVGTTGLFFDDHNKLYVNTTTATPDNVKYSRQIDVNDKVVPLVLKVDPRGGKTLWAARDEGLVSHIAGKLVYTAETHPGQNPNGDNDPLADLKGVFEIPPHIRVRRLDAGNGRVLWQHYEKRAPLDVRFEGNSFQVLFKREVEVLRFISF